MLRDESLEAYDDGELRYMLTHFLDVHVKNEKKTERVIAALFPPAYNLSYSAKPEHTSHYQGNNKNIIIYLCNHIYYLYP
jgi:hypothetical protein